MGTQHSNSDNQPEEHTKPVLTHAPKAQSTPTNDKPKQRRKRDRQNTYDMALVERYAAAGLSHSQTALCLGISESTLSRLKKRDDFKEAYKKGIQNPIRQVETSLFLKCLGFKVKENGKEKYFAPSDLAIMYYLNNKAPHLYKHASHIEQNLTQTIAFPEFDKLPLAQKQKVLVLMERKAKGEDIGPALADLQKELAVIQPGQQQ